MAVAAGSLVLSACGGNHVDQLKDGKTAKGHKVSQDTASPSASPSGDAKTTSARAKALAAYQAYWKARVAQMAHPTPNDSSADKYAIDKAVGELGATVNWMHQHGLEERGTPGHKVDVTSVQLNSPPDDPSKVSLHDCLDVTHVKNVKASSGKTVKPTKPVKRYTADAVVRSVGSDWRVSSLQFNLDSPC